MKYKFKGSLVGYLCDDCSEPLAGVEVLLYTPWKKESVNENVTAPTKETFRLVSQSEMSERKELLVARTKADEKGNFEFSLDEKYGNTAFDLDFSCGTVPRKIPVAPKKEPLQFHLTTIQPDWQIEREKEIALFNWDGIIAHKWWCNIRGRYFDAWVICGHMYACDTQIPLKDVKVIAMDADFLTDDNLGYDITDANGHFRIEYTSADFKKTFLSPIINIETDPSWPLSFVSGPDVYFKYEYNGAAIQGESRSQSRKNVGHCLCVRLCLKDIVTTTDGVPASFTKIGNNGKHFINETVAGGHPNVIALATGKTTSNQAFYSCISLVGNLNKKLNGQPMEYCFETIETNGAAGAEMGVWKKVNASGMCEAEIGTFITLTLDPMNPVVVVPYSIGIVNGGVDADGWIKLPQADNFFPNVNGQMLGLNTAMLNGATVNMAGLVQGQSTTSIAPLQQNRFFKIRMIKRQVGNAATEVFAGVSNPIAMFNTVYQNVPQFGSWMPQTSSEMGVACIDIQEMIGGGGGTGCTPITTQLHINYTAANPNMGSVSLTLYGPGGPYSVQNVAPLGGVAETNGVATELHNPAIVPINLLSKCAYTAIMSVELKLTNGESQHSNIEDWLSFCKG